MKHINFMYHNEEDGTGNEYSYFFEDSENQRDNLMEMFKKFLESVGYVFPAKSTVNLPNMNAYMNDADKFGWYSKKD